MAFRSSDVREVRLTRLEVDLVEFLGLLRSAPGVALAIHGGDFARFLEIEACHHYIAAWAGILAVEVATASSSAFRLRFFVGIVVEVNVIVAIIADFLGVAHVYVNSFGYVVIDIGYGSIVLEDIRPALGVLPDIAEDSLGRAYLDPDTADGLGICTILPKSISCEQLLAQKGKQSLCERHVHDGNRGAARIFSE